MISWILIFLVIIYLILYRFYHYHSDEPVLYNRNIPELDFLTFDYLRDEHGEQEIYATLNSSVYPDMASEKRYRTMTLRTFLDDKISEYYFKSEDLYSFLKDIKLKPLLDKIFPSYFPLPNVLYRSYSFWCGGKGTTTAWHTDIEDHSVLYVITGKKKILVAKPSSDMYPRDKYFLGSLWSQIDFKEPDLDRYPKYKDVEIKEFLLKAGDALYIPRNWWHCVENLEPTIAITYLSYRLPYLFFGIIPEFIRYLWYLNRS